MLRLLVPLLLLSCLVPLSLWGAELRTLEIEYSFTPPDYSGGSHVGYRLYKEGQLACETADTVTNPMVCDIMTDSGTFDFTLTALYSDNTESPPSISFSYTISTLPPGEVSKTLAIEYSFTAPPLSGVTHVGYRLYKEGQPACETADTTTNPMVCNILTGVGTFDFSLTALYSDNTESAASSPFTLTITDTPPILPPPSAAFTVTPTSGEAPLSVSFDASASSGEIASYSWAFGDGGTGVGGNATHTYQEAGNYTATLTIADASGVTDTSSVGISVAEQPLPPLGASISALPTSGEAPLSVSFDASASGGEIASYSWAFGDGGTGAGVSASHTYQEAGSYTATLTIADASGATDTGSVGISVAEQPLPPLGASISATPTSGEAPLSVSFNASASSGEIASYSWSFGDGGSGTGVSTSHTYQEAGNYTATLTIADASGATDTSSVGITAAEQSPPLKASISTDTTSGAPPLAVAFNGTGSTGEIVSYQWSFGDNNQGSGSAVGHTYEAAGSYTATLVVSDSAGNSSQDTVNITVGETASHTLTIEYTFSPPNIAGVDHVGYLLYKDGQPVCETAETTATPFSCDITSEDGTFNFTLTALYSDDSESPHSAPFTLSIGTPAEPPLSAAIVATPLAGDAPLSVSFDGSGSSGEITAYEWNFGDGGLGRGVTADHAYATKGNFTASLVVRDQAGNTNQESVIISVQEPTEPPTTEPPTAVIASSNPIGDKPHDVSFEGNGSTTNQPPIVSYEWNFGDGSTAIGEAVAHTFNVAGSFDTILTVTDSASLSDQASTPILVTDSGSTPNEPPQAVISVTSSKGEVPFTVGFDGSESSDAEGAIASYKWSFGDGSTATGATTEHIYTIPGTYTATLQVTDSAGETGSSSTTITALESVLPEFYFELQEVQVRQKWQRFEFAQQYKDPVVIVGPPTYKDPTPVAVQVRNVDSIGFEMQLGRWEYLKGKHAWETVTYMVVERGSYTLADGTKIEVGTFTADSSFTEVKFTERLNREPVLLTQVLTVNESGVVVGRLRNVDLIGFEYQLQEQESTQSNHGQESIGYIAWESGSGFFPENQLAYEAVLTPNSITDSWATITYQSGFSDIPLFLATMQTTNESDTAALRMKDAGTSSVKIKVEEEQSQDQEVSHAPETVGYLVIGSTPPGQE